MKKILTIIAFFITTSIFAQDTFTQKHSEQAHEDQKIDRMLSELEQAENRMEELNEKLDKRATEIAKAYDKQLEMTTKQFILFEKKVEEFLITRNKIENNFTGKNKLAKLYNMQREETAEMADILTSIQLDVYKQIKDDIQPLETINKK